MLRIKNSASVEDICKVMRAELPNGLKHDSFMRIDLAAVADHHHPFICSLLEKTHRPTSMLLEKSAMKAFQVSSEEASAFASRICKCISMCRNKLKSMTSGAKLSVGVKNIAKQLKLNGSSEVSPLVASLKKRALKRCHSSDSEVVLLVNSKAAVKQSGFSIPAGSSNRMSSALSSNATKEEILAAYGMDVRSPTLPLLNNDTVLEIPDSQDAKTMEAPQPQPWLCNKDLCLKQILPSGAIQNAVMAAGSEGFAIATFPGSKPIVTELPNLMLHVGAASVMKKPAGSVMKKPAGSVMKKQASVRDMAENEYDSELDGEAAPASCMASVHGGKPPASGGSPPEISVPKPLPWKNANFKFEASVWGQCKAEFYTGQSYIRFLNSLGKWQLLVATRKKDHHQNLLSLVQEVKKGLSKEELVSIRDSLEAEDVW
jgi:hypothetical protein